MSLKIRLTLWNSIILMIFMTAGFTAVYFVIQSTLVDMHRRDIYRNYIEIADEIEEYDGHLIIDLDTDDEEELTYGLIFSLYNEQGEWIDGRRVMWVDDLPATEGEITEIKINGKSWLMLDNMVEDRGREGLLRILLPLDSVTRMLELITGIGVASMIPCFLLAFLTGLLTVERALKPVGKIAAAAKQIGEGDLSKRISISNTNDEIGHLSKEFNRMADKLEKSFTREKRFTSDASHEMRTPVAVILASAEDALNADDPKIYKSAVSAIFNRAVHMQKMLADMLSLARGEKQADFSRLDLSATLTDIVQEYEQEHDNIKTDIQCGITINADQMQITRMVMNLIDNAVKYGGDGGISIKLRAQDGNAVINIADCGQGISPDDLPHIFDRFYRADKSRTAGSGAGLGLSIAMQAAEMHGGTITAESEYGKGTVFSVILPLSK